MPFLFPLIVIFALFPGIGFGIAISALSHAPLNSGPSEIESLDVSVENSALIITDMWDYHHCYSAYNRSIELAPRINELVRYFREQGGTIIHAPSNCIKNYITGSMANQVLESQSFQSNPNTDTKCCPPLPLEPPGGFPLAIGVEMCDTDPDKNRTWRRKLDSIGRNPKKPWMYQTPLIKTEKGDFISESWPHIRELFVRKKIDDVFLAGISSNICILNRPFGLKSLVRNKFNAILISDLTDALYAPTFPPFVDHFTGNRKVINYIRTYIAPTTTSDQFLGGDSFRFKNDTPTKKLFTNLFILMLFLVPALIFMISYTSSRLCRNRFWNPIMILGLSTIVCSAYYLGEIPSLYHLTKYLTIHLGITLDPPIFLHRNIFYFVPIFVFLISGSFYLANAIKSRLMAILYGIISCVLMLVFIFFTSFHGFFFFRDPTNNTELPLLIGAIFGVAMSLLVVKTGKTTLN